MIDTTHSSRTLSIPEQARAYAKNVAIPTEHGGWMFVLEPALAGLLVAFTAPGLFLSFAALFAFLVRRPFKLAFDDYRRGKKFARTPWAWFFLCLFGCLAIGWFTVACLTAIRSFLIPLLIALPFALLLLLFDTNKRNRELLAETSGAVALGSVASAITLAAGWTLIPSLLLWLILIFRSVTSILYVRTRLRLEYGKYADVAAILFVHTLATGVIVFLCVTAGLPWMVAVASAFLFLRAVLGLSRWRIGSAAKSVGIQETIIGFLYVAAIAAGYHLIP